MVNGFPELVYEARNEDQLQLGPNATSLDLLQAVYRNTAIPLSVRMRAAGMAIQFECPKLLATAIVNEGSFAELLERRIQRLNQMKLIEQSPTPPAEPTDGRIPPPVPDRRWRRI